MASKFPDHIIAMWLGDNAMNENRLRGWNSFGVTGLKPILITPENLDEWIVKEEPLHPAYPLLSVMHQADYLRAYLMFHHGGGYADVKPQTGDWTKAIGRVTNSSRLIAAGYREVRGGTPLIERNLVQGRAFVLDRPAPSWRARLVSLAMRAARPLLMGNCAYWFKPHTPFARKWLDAIHKRLNVLHPLLVKNPAREIKEYVGGPSGYPVPWAFMHGDVLSYMSMLNIGRIHLGIPRPEFTNYL